MCVSVYVCMCVCVYLCMCVLWGCVLGNAICIVGVFCVVGVGVIGIFGVVVGPWDV